MGQFLGFGNGSDGAATLSGTDAPIDASCSGTSGSTSLSATNVSFAANQIIFIKQMRGTDAGKWELNQIASYVAGTITTRIPLSYTYTDSGDNQAQVIVVKQYTSVTISGTFTTKAWDGNLGGVTVFMASGPVIISGTLTADGKGYRGGAGGTTASMGEGWPALGTISDSINGNGASGIASGGGAGGGGGHANAGGNGGGGSNNGEGGNAVGSVDMTQIYMGGGAGGGADPSNSSGGAGGGIIMIFGKNITISGSVTAAGLQASAANWPGGGGAGGSVFLKGERVNVGTNLITALGGASRTGVGTSGAGSEGRIRIEACNITGTTNPVASESEGGHSFCTAGYSIL